MALRFLEGFEVRQHSDYFARVYDSYSGLTGANVTTGRKGFGTAIEGTNMQFRTRALVSAPENTWIMQFALRKQGTNDLGANYGTIIFESGSGLDQCELRWVAAGSPNTGAFIFEFRRGSTVLATSAPIGYGNTVRAWRTFQLKVTVRTGTNGAFELKGWDWQGTAFTIFSATTSVNTANQASDGADRVYFRTSNGGTGIFAMDDIVIMDSTGSANNDFTSVPLIVYGELPNADGGTQDWDPSTPGTHYTLVQDGAQSPSGTGEITSETVGEVDLFGFAQTQLDLAPTASPPAVLGIMVDFEGLMKTSGTRTVRVRVADGIDEADDTTDLVFSDTAKISRYALLEQNPTGTPAAWTIADLKTVELGPKVTA